MKKKIIGLCCALLCMLCACTGQDHLTGMEVPKEALCENYVADLTDEEITVIICREDYDKVFTSQVVDVDFEKEQLIVYPYMAINHRSISRCTGTKQDASLAIDVEWNRPSSCQPIGDTCAPYQRYLVFKTQRHDWEDITVNVH